MPVRSSGLAALLVLALGVAPAGGLRRFSKSAPPKDYPSTVLKSGPVLGDWVDGLPGARVARFLGIPFAASTAGAGRWRPPAPVLPWGPDPWFATKVGPACAQAQPPGDPDGALAQRARSRRAPGAHAPASPRSAGVPERGLPEPERVHARARLRSFRGRGARRCLLSRARASTLRTVAAVDASTIRVQRCFRCRQQRGALRRL